MADRPACYAPIPIERPNASARVKSHGPEEPLIAALRLLAGRKDYPVIDLAPQLSFSGQCRPAFEFYAALLSGEITVMNRFGGNEDHALPPGSRTSQPDHIRYAEIAFANGILRGNDVPAGDFAAMRGFNIALHCDNAAEARRIFDALADGGTVTTEPAKVDWAELFAMVEDRFGVPWLILASGG